MISKTKKAHLQKLIQEKNLPELKQAVARITPESLAPLFETFSPTDRLWLFRALERHKAADTFAFLDEEHQELLLAGLTDQETREVLANLSPDDRTFLLEDLPAPAMQKLLSLLNPEDRKETLTLLGYPADSVGRLMSPDFATVHPQMTVREAMQSIKKQAPDSETLNMIYITDDDGKLIDDIRLRRFITSAEDRAVADLMDHHFTSLTTNEPEEHAVRLMKKTGYFALPVTDAEGTLLGVVTADDVLDVAVEAATEDIHKGGAIKPLEMSYLKAPLATLYTRRISWLIILVFMNIFSGAGIAHFEELIESVVALVFFLPLLIDSGGNAGSQAATLVIRAMALGEVRIADYIKVAWRELRVSIFLGLSMALAVFFLGWWRSGIDVGIVVCLSMVCIVIFGSLVGMSLPFILRKLKQDPAAASAPLVTSIADISGVLIYLSIASALLGAITE